MSQLIFFMSLAFLWNSYTFLNKILYAILSPFYIHVLVMQRFSRSSFSTNQLDLSEYNIVCYSQYFLQSYLSDVEVQQSGFFMKQLNISEYNIACYSQSVFSHVLVMQRLSRCDCMEHGVELIFDMIIINKNHDCCGTIF